MSSDPYAADWQEDEQAIDPESEMIAPRDEDDMDTDVDLPRVGDPHPVQVDTVGPAGLDATVDAFVELITARDLDGLAELFAPDVEARFLDESSATGACEGLGDMLLRHPDLMVTRGDLGPMPVAGAWLFDQEQHDYHLMGYFVLEVADADPERIEVLDFVEEPADSDELVVELPERDDLSEWDDWTTQDEG